MAKGIALATGLGALVAMAAIPIAAAANGDDRARSGAAIAATSPEWEELIAAAQEEGELQLFGRPDPGHREIADAFADAFDIEVVTTFGRDELNTRIENERAAGIYTPDVMFDGNINAHNFYTQGFLRPITPVLLDEVVDPEAWACHGCDHTGPLPFIDPENSYILRLVNTVIPYGLYNTELVEEGELQTFDDLLDPQFEGLIGMRDPRGGSGRFNANLFASIAGDDFVSTLFAEQQPLLFEDSRQLEEELLRGSIAIMLSPSGSTPVDTERLKAEGHPVEYIWGLQGGAYPAATFSTGLLVEYFADAPHPNAAALFFNWLMTPEGAELYARTLNFPSTRADLSNEWVAAQEAIPQPEVGYLDLFSWEQTELTNEPEHVEHVLELTGVS